MPISLISEFCYLPNLLLILVPVLRVEKFANGHETDLFVTVIASGHLMVETKHGQD